MMSSFCRKWCNYLFLTAIVLVVSLYLKSWVRSICLALVLPGPRALPILGNIFLIKDNKQFLRFGETVAQKYGLLFRAWLTVIPVVIILDPKHLQCILGSTKLVEKNFLYSLMHTFIGSGLITNNGNKWKLHRRYIQPYFNLNILERFVKTFSEEATALVERLRTEKAVKITNFVNHCILDILHQAILGIPTKEQKTEENSPFRKGQVVLTQRILRPWFLLNISYKFTAAAKQEVQQKRILREFIKKVLEERKQDKKLGAVPRWCLLESFLEISENNPDFTEEDVISEICTFMLAGQDSVGAAVSFSLYFLAKHSDIQEKVFEELNDVFKKPSSLSMPTLNKMKYLEQCIKEAIRLCPSVPLIARKLTEDVKLDEYVIPSGTNIFISPYVTHRLPQYFPNPDKFDPDRFSSGDQNKTHSFAYIPFSAGPRNCIGYKFAMLEMKTIISAILRTYKISLVPGYKLEVTYRVTLRAKGGIWLRLCPR